jgi:hypothetical protein
MVQHAPKDFRGHDQAAGIGIDGDIACHQPHIPKLLLELAVLLVGQCFEWGGVNDTLVVPVETAGEHKETPGMPVNG